jgi:hypothetical protein
LPESYIQADETPVPEQMADGRGKNHQAFLWQYGKPGGNVVFDFRLGRERDGPVAAVLSVVETCRRLEMPVREYLAWVLPGLRTVPVQRVPQYTPATCAASRNGK